MHLCCLELHSVSLQRIPSQDEQTKLGKSFVHLYMYLSTGVFHSKLKILFLHIPILNPPHPLDLT